MENYLNRQIFVFQSKNDGRIIRSYDIPKDYKISQFTNRVHTIIRNCSFIFLEHCRR